MLCDPDAYLRLQYGPEGDFWYSEGENAYLTDEYLAWLEAGNSGVNGYPMSDGTEFAFWNTGFCVNQGERTTYGDGVGGKRGGTLEYWTEVQEITTANDNFNNWKETTGHANLMEWLETENAYYDTSEVSTYQAYMGTPTDSMQLTIDSLKDTVVTASWKMVYAETEAQFDEIWNQMLKDCEGLGAQDVIDWKLADVESAKELAR